METASYANVTKSTVSKFVKNHMSVWNAKRIIFDNVLNLNNNTISKVCSLFTINAISPKKKMAKKKTLPGQCLSLGPIAVLPIEDKILSEFLNPISIEEECSKLSIMVKCAKSK